MYIVSRANMLYVSVHRSAGGEQSIDISDLPRIMLLASQVCTVTLITLYHNMKHEVIRGSDHNHHVEWQLHCLAWKLVRRNRKKTVYPNIVLTSLLSCSPCLPLNFAALPFFLLYLLQAFFVLFAMHCYNPELIKCPVVEVYLPENHGEQAEQSSGCWC